MKIEDLTSENIRALEEYCCEACKGLPYMRETGCYKTCEAVLDELKGWEENELRPEGESV